MERSSKPISNLETRNYEPVNDCGMRISELKTITFHVSRITRFRNAELKLSESSIKHQILRLKALGPRRKEDNP